MQLPFRLIVSFFILGSLFICACTLFYLSMAKMTAHVHTLSNEMHDIRSYCFAFADFNLFGDPNCSLFRFWAFVEVSSFLYFNFKSLLLSLSLSHILLVLLRQAKYLSNLPKARELWSEVMKRKHGNEAHMWLEYINFER